MGPRVWRWTKTVVLSTILLAGLGSCASSNTATSVHVGVGVGYGGYYGYGRGWGYPPGYRPGRPIGRPPIAVRPRTPDVPAAAPAVDVQ